MITLTDSATSKVQELIKAEGNDELTMRVAVRTGGCSGYSCDVLRHRVHRRRQRRRAGWREGHHRRRERPPAHGCPLDYKDNQGAGFAINNPNATRSCGCGSSFS